MSTKNEVFGTLALADAAGMSVGAWVEQTLRRIPRSEDGAGHDPEPAGGRYAGQQHAERMRQRRGAAGEAVTDWKEVLHQEAIRQQKPAPRRRSKSLAHTAR